VTSQGTEGEKWIYLPEARAGAGFAGNDRQCDFLTICSWPSQGLQVIGHEIKVSMSDWRRELAQADKAETFARYCRRWWIVAPTELCQKIKPELPPTWGLMAVNDAGKTREVVAAPSRTPQPIPAMWWVGWLAQVDRRQKRADKAVIDRAVTDALKIERDKHAKALAALPAVADQQLHIDLRNAQRRLDGIKTLEETLGITLHAGLTEYQLRDLKGAWQIWRKQTYLASALQGLAKQIADVQAALAEESAA
jgi:hypothetical protein